ncbi:MAG: MFS transporter [Candidatus Gracilibacteria bacterium]|nr:MFS transporter [Candidatus Gracilibacteria bacterium]
MSLKKFALPIILLTVLLDIIGLGIIIPSLPSIIRGFGLSENWVGFVFASFSIGMFLGGIVFGRLSDVYGRKNILAITSFINMLGYLVFAFSGNVYLFILGRLLSGLGGAGMAIGQAYVADISTAENRTKNLGLTGAMFGLGFTIGPVLGGLFSSNSHLGLGLISASIIFLNFLIILFFLPNIPKKHLESKDEAVFPLDFHHHKKQIYLLFSIAFILSLGFSAMQTTFALLLTDRFVFSEKMIGYCLGLIGVASIIYQAFLVQHVRKWLDEKGMILFGLASLAISFTLFAVNPYFLGIFIIIAFFPLGQGSINPAVGSLHAHYAGKEVGKALGTNASMMSLGSIAGPFLAGYLYILWNGAPYIASSVFFIFAFILAFWGLRKTMKK